MKRRWKLLAVIVVVIAAAVYLVLPHGGSRRRVEALKQQLRDRGEKLTMLELAPKVSSNGVAAGKAFTNLLDGFRVLPEFPASIKLLAPGVGIPGHTIMEPSQMNGYASNLAASAELRSILKTNALEFDLDFSQGTSVPLFHLAKLKSAAQLLSIASVQALHENNRVEAWSNIMAEADYLRNYLGDPLMISDLVRVAAAIIAITATWDGLQEDGWTPEQLSDLQALWEEVNFTNNLELIVLMERAFGIAAVADARRWTYQQFQSNPVSGRSPAPASDEPLAVVKQDLVNLRERYLFWSWKQSGSYDDEAYDIQNANAGLECSRLIQLSGAFLPALKALDEEVARLESHYPESKSRGGLNRYSPDMFRRYFERMAAAEAARHLLITAIALKRYHLQQGAYPENLNALVPAFIKAVPKDPWDGKPLRYKNASEGGFVLYSVGKDGEDNGGDASKDGRAAPEAFDILGRDFVWPRLATPAEVKKYREGQSKTNDSGVK